MLDEVAALEDAAALELAAVPKELDAATELLAGGALLELVATETELLSPLPLLLSVAAEDDEGVAEDDVVSGGGGEVELNDMFVELDQFCSAEDDAGAELEEVND